MLPPSVSRCAVRCALCAVRAAAAAFLVFTGCQPVVREERTIAIGPDGQASFQHGRNGVFVTDPATWKPKRIYEPRPDDLAIGPPAWEPNGRRMVFAVARPADGVKYEPLRDGLADGPRPEVIGSRRRFAAEAFLSPGMAAEGIEYFRREFDEAKADRERLSAAIVLCQLLLITDRRKEYAEEVTEHQLPLASRVIPLPGRDQDNLMAVVTLTIFPLAAMNFIEELPENTIRTVVESTSGWPRTEDDVGYACRLVLRECDRRLGKKEIATEENVRIATHPARSKWQLPPSGEVDHEFLFRFRADILFAEAVRDQFGAGAVIGSGTR